MKKLVLTLALVISSVMAFATITNSSLVNYDNSNHFNNIDKHNNTIIYDSVIAKNDESSIILSKIVFYNIDRVVITNNKKQYIKIENERGEIVVETNEDIDMQLIPGNYSIYTSADHLIGFYK